MAKTRLRDIEVYVDGTTLNVIPYKLELNADGYFSPDTSDSGQGERLEIEMNDENHNEVAYVLDLEQWKMRLTWDGFSEWNTTEYLTKGEAPARVKEWLDRMPEYDIKWREIR